MSRRPHWGSMKANPPQMNHGDAERMYDMMAYAGMNPVPWQLELLRTLEQLSMDAKFASIVSGKDD